MSKNKSKKTKIIVSIVFLSITILFLSCKRQEFSREVRALYGTVVSIPSNLEPKHMRKRTYSIIVLFISLIGLTLRARSQETKYAERLIAQNIRALLQDNDQSEDELIMYCPKDDNYQSYCIAKCPICHTMWQSIFRGSGAYLKGTCPRCGHKFEP